MDLPFSPHLTMSEIILTGHKTQIKIERPRRKHNGLIWHWQSKLNMSQCMSKLTNWSVWPAKNQISLGICPVWSASSLYAWRRIGSWATQWMPNEDWSDYVATQFILLCSGSYMNALFLPGYLRLGCMARNRGQIYEASDWFKEALQINQVKQI